MSDAMKYRFLATFTDGHQILQHEEDLSFTKEGGSSFSDVLEYEKTVPLKCFVLVDLLSKNTFGVDLIDGHFEINGLPFKCHEERLSNLRLIFFRRHTHSKTMSNNPLLDGKNETHDIVFRFGWQATQNGKNVQEVIEIW